ncbi:MAG: uroporphyrinogen-III synthase [Alphaproteobacteria bacterium]|nr:uroporphyrinogen-III synthase [Alphaproteobacteria bacterium]MBP7757896.1 uroporphyrinogen-III synthase [Alphaproteobacteria bacterium]MBP7761223.1 uroporphyrinogen-III synthase [Alphaproteobacteria bacterium]MBP7905171.1 uroporphyrinogen-III synthase [Alphaproteobacteria bacterium]
MTQAHFPRLLITRPTDQGQDFIAALAEAVGDAFHTDRFTLLPFMDIAPVHFRLASPKGFDGVIMTSTNGLRHFAGKVRELSHGNDWAQGYLSLPLYVVGEGTAQKAKVAGFENVRMAAESADALKNYLLGLAASLSPKKGKKLRLLFVRGDTVHADFETILPNDLFDVIGAIVYTAQPSLLPEGFLKELVIKKDFDAVAFFSARTARLFFEQAQKDNLLLNLKKPEALCISKNVLETVRSFWGRSLYVADSPNQEGMVELVVRRLKALEQTGQAIR